MHATWNRLKTTAGAKIGDLLARAGVSAPAAPDHYFPDADVACLHEVTGTGDAAADAQTWDGMLMPAYFAILTGGTAVKPGIYGRQQLYAWLRGGQDDAGRAGLRERLQVLEGENARLDELAAICLPLRAAETEVAGALYGVDEAIPAWAGKCWLLGTGLVVSAAAVFYSPVAWLAVVLLMSLMIVLQLRYYVIVEEGARVPASLRQMLRCCSLAANCPHPALKDFAALGGRAGRINRALSPSPLRQLLGIGVYLDWFLQANLEHHFRSRRLIGAEREFLQHCYRLCARLEADLTLALHRAAVATCPASSGPAIDLAMAVHPLLHTPSPLSIAAGADGRGLFVSGQNGIGKSTLLRTVGLNLLVARAFGFCYAESARVPMLPVVASMQSDDSLLDGDSLYVAELKRARVVLDIAASGRGAVFIIDEIFRGTNHIESVAAAAAVLDELAAAHLVLVSSHNLVLARLLAHRLAPLCVMRDTSGALVLNAGVLADVNGVALLARHGFGAGIEAKARRVANWLGACMAEPPGACAVLAPAPPVTAQAA